MYLFPLLIFITSVGNWIFFNSRYITQCSLSASYLWSTTVEYLLLFISLWLGIDNLFVFFITFSPSVIWDIHRPNELFLTSSLISILAMHWISILVASFLTPLLNQVTISAYEMIHYDHRNSGHLKRFLFLLISVFISNQVMWTVSHFLHPEIFY